jgi:hypothetical protein
MDDRFPASGYRLERNPSLPTPTQAGKGQPFYTAFRYIEMKQLARQLLLRAINQVL